MRDEGRKAQKTAAQEHSAPVRPSKLLKTALSNRYSANTLSEPHK